MRTGTSAATAAGLAVGNASPEPRVYGLGDWDTSTRLATGTGQGILGSTAGFWVRMLWWPTSVTGASAVRSLAANNPTNQGWRVRNGLTNTQHEFRVIVTGPTEIASPVLVLTSAHVNKLLDSLWVWDPALDKLRFYLNGVEIGTTDSIVDCIPAVAERTILGTTNGGSSPASDCVIAAMEGGDGSVPTAGEVLSAHTLTRARVAASMPPLAGIAGKTSWRAQVPRTWNQPVFVDDDIGSADLTIVTGTASNLILSSIPGLWA